MADFNMEHCTQCPNQCPVTDLKCGRGRKYFGQQSEGEKEDHRHEHGAEYRERHDHEHGEEHRHEHGHERGEEHGHEHGEGHGHEHRHDHIHRQDMFCGQDDLYSMLRACGHYLFHRFGKNMGQGRILSILSERESITQKELQEMLRIQPGSMTEILTKLEEKGLVRRKKDEEDKRRCIIELTEDGQKSSDRRKQQEEEQTRLFASLDDAEQEELKRLLGKLLESWEQDDVK